MVIGVIFLHSQMNGWKNSCWLWCWLFVTLSAGFYSFRNSMKGSAFITAVAKVFREHGDTMEISRLLTRVNYEVSRGFESRASDASFSHKKQAPSFESLLTKELYFPRKTWSRVTTCCSRQVDQPGSLELGVIRQHLAGSFAVLKLQNVQKCNSVIIICWKLLSIYNYCMAVEISDQLID